MTKLEKLLGLNVNEFTSVKGRLTYLSWSHAWKEFIKVYPDATYEILKDVNGLPWFGDNEKGYMTFTKVTAEGLTHEMFLPCMDFKNKSMLKPTTFDLNKTIMRCLTKNLAMFGLGLYIYSGEDLPEEEQKELDANVVKAEQEKDITLLRKRCAEGQAKYNLEDEKIVKLYGAVVSEMTLSYLRNFSTDLSRKDKAK